MNTQEKIYNMLTESTGTHFLDSGMTDNRHWQQNQKKTLQDFQNENHFQVEKNEYGDNQVEWLLNISLFHHLSNSLTYDEQETNNLNSFLESEGLVSDMAGIDEYVAAGYCPGGQELRHFVPCLICNDEDCIDKNGTHITNNMVTGFSLPNLQTIKN